MSKAALHRSTRELPRKYVEWNPLKAIHQRAPIGFWTKTENQRVYFENLANQVGIQNLDDWYGKLSKKLLMENHGKGLLDQYKSSAIRALMATYPDHNWMPWRFNHVSRDYWKPIENQRKYFDWLGKQLGVVQLDDWYLKLSKKVVLDNGGRYILLLHNESPISALTTIYAEHNWIPQKFNHIPRDYWKVHENQRKFFDDLGKRIGINSLEDWYEKLSGNVILENGGSGVLGRNNSSPTTALMAAYPEYNWLPWKFAYVSHGLWKSTNNVSVFLAELSEKLSIQNLDDWYRVDTNQLYQCGAGTLLAKSRLYDLLKQQYPHHPWDPKKFQQKGKKAQRWLAVTLKKLYPNEGGCSDADGTNIIEILEDYMHPKILLPSSNRPMQLDVFIPSKSLAFEYQGIQHYQEVGVFNPSKTYQQRDEEKRTLCASNNIKLIEVPYWWNRTQHSLQEMITQ